MLIALYLETRFKDPPAIRNCRCKIRLQRREKVEGHLKGLSLVGVACLYANC